MKKLLVMALSVIMCMTFLVACGDNDGDYSANPSETTKQDDMSRFEDDMSKAGDDIKDGVDDTKDDIEKGIDDLGDGMKGD